jgi:hypothetical protein
MDNLLEELKKYFKNTPRSKVMEDWAKSAEYDKVGPTVEEFISCSPYHYTSNVLSITNQQHIQSNLSSKFSSGFFLNVNLNSSICKQPHFQL